MQKLIEKIKAAKHVAAFTGAGVSTLCGIPDFRGPQGLYKNPDAERIFDIDWFRRDPSIYYRGCRELVYGLRSFSPGPVHKALARLQAVGKCDGIVTQNIDMLHQKAGSSPVYEVHGSPILHHCPKCGGEKTFGEICAMLERTEVAWCEKCGRPHAYKPDITFFGEMLPEEAFSGAIRLAEHADLMLVLGSSLTVSPANAIPPLTLRANGQIAIVNAQPTHLDDSAALCYKDLAEFASAILEAFPAPCPPKG